MTVGSVERAVEMVVLAAVAWPAVGPTVQPAFRRAFPALARMLYDGADCVRWSADGRVLCAFAPSWLLRRGAYRPWRHCGRSLALRGRPRARARLARGIVAALALGPWCRQTSSRTSTWRYGSPFKTSQFLRPTACVVGLADGLDLVSANTTPRWSRRRGRLAASFQAGSSGTCRESATPRPRRCSAGQSSAERGPAV